MYIYIYSLIITHITFTLNKSMFQKRPVNVHFNSQVRGIELCNHHSNTLKLQINFGELTFILV